MEWREMTRAQRLEEIGRLRGQGLLVREVAEHFGVRVGTISAYVNDPDRSKRKERLREEVCRLRSSHERERRDREGTEALRSLPRQAPE